MKVLVADDHAQIFTKSSDHGSDQVGSKERRWVRRLPEGRGEDQSGKKDRQGHHEKRPQQSFIETQCENRIALHEIEQQQSCDQGRVQPRREPAHSHGDQISRQNHQENTRHHHQGYKPGRAKIERTIRDALRLQQQKS